MPLLVMAWVPGAPKTKGSLAVRNGKTGALRESVAGSTRWRQLMAKAFVTARQQAEPWAGPAGVTAYFYLPRDDPATTRAGDIDKLTRNVLDALEDARIWADDVQCVTLDVRKLGARLSPRDGPGAFVTVVGYEQW